MQHAQVASIHRRPGLESADNVLHPKRMGVSAWISKRECEFPVSLLAIPKAECWNQLRQRTILPGHSLTLSVDRVILREQRENNEVTYASSI